MRAALLVAAVLLLVGCGGSKAKAERSILLVSGRDDHGLVAQKEIGLRRWIGGEPDSKVPDGTLVRIESTHGEWIEVRAIEGRAASGWVNDYYLRGTAHVTRRVSSLPLNAQVELLDVDGSSVQVRTLETKRVAWVPRNAVSEMPAS